MGLWKHSNEVSSTIKSWEVLESLSGWWLLTSSAALSTGCLVLQKAAGTLTQSSPVQSSRDWSIMAITTLRRQANLLILDIISVYLWHNTWFESSEGKLLCHVCRLLRLSLQLHLVSRIVYLWKQHSTVALHTQCQNMGLRIVTCLGMWLLDGVWIGWLDLLHL
jgi:hypothetical protein